MTNYAKQPDSNHAEVKKLFQDAGWYWRDRFRWGGELDGQVCKRGPRGCWMTIMIEVKHKDTARLTSAEIDFFSEWPAEKLVACDAFAVTVAETLLRERY